MGRNVYGRFAHEETGSERVQSDKASSVAQIFLSLKPALFPLHVAFGVHVT